MRRGVGEEIVDERTGEVAEPVEHIRNLRGLERELRRLDEAIDAMKADLKATRQEREKRGGQLRALIREGKVVARTESRATSRGARSTAAAPPAERA